MIDATVEPRVLVRGLTHHFGQGDNRKQVLYDVDLDLMPGEVVIMTGPSGSGKTTLLTLIGTLRSLQQGTLKVLGRDYSNLDHKSLVQARRDIGFIFQTHNLFSSLTAFRNVRMAVELRRLPNRQTREMVEDILRKVGLQDRIHYKPDQLSGGQRQRVAFARALVNRPRLILADEPTAALDEKSGRDVFELLKQLAEVDRATVLAVTHDNRILEYADRIVNMVDGRIASNVLVQQSLEICDFLRKCEVFQSMTPTGLTEVSQQMESQEFAENDEIVRQGEPGDKFYIIRSGRVDVKVRSSGKTSLVVSLQSGDYFGEAALLTGEPRNASVVATSEVEVYWLDKESFQDAVERSSSFGDQLRDVFFRRA